MSTPEKKNQESESVKDVAEKARFFAKQSLDEAGLEKFLTFVDTDFLPLAEEVAAYAEKTGDQIAFDRFITLQASALDLSLDPMGDRLLVLGEAFPDQVRMAVANTVGLDSADGQSILDLLASIGGQVDIEALPAAGIAADVAHGIPQEFITASQQVPLSTIQQAIHAVYRATRTISGTVLPVYNGTLQILQANGTVLHAIETNTGGFIASFRRRNGPVPPGIYRASNFRSPRNDMGNAMKRFGISFSINLTPTAGTEVFGRSALEIHPDGPPAGTHGCLGLVPQSADELATFRDALRGLLGQAHGFFVGVVYE